jgi:hypothetical protein
VCGQLIVPVTPPWVGHGNLIGVRVGIELTAHSAIDDVGTASRFAFARFAANAGGERRRVRFVVAQSTQCPGPSTLSMEVGPTPPGWSAIVTPQIVTLNPGQRSVVTVMVMPPVGAAVGTHAVIPVTVAYPMVMSNRVPGLAVVGANAATTAGAFSQLYSPGIHMIGVGALTVLGRVTGGPGALRLASMASVPAGRGRSHTDGDEARNSEDLATPFSAASYATVQAHWAGDNAHDPTDSQPLWLVPLAPSH